MDEFKEAIRDCSPMAIIAMLGGAVRYGKHHRNEKFNLFEFIVGMACSGLVGIIVYGLCDLLALSEMTKAAIVAMAGYCGSSLLDAVRDGAINAVSSFFEALVKKINGSSGE